MAKLVTQLGYPASEEDVLTRFKFIQNLAGHEIFVAVGDSLQVIGWIHILQFPTLEMTLSTELGGLVVDSEYRGRGIGKQLLAAAEKWSLNLGIKRLQFTSQMKRSEAHVFYQKQGYKIIKNSFYFSKDLTDQTQN